MSIIDIREQREDIRQGLHKFFMIPLSDLEGELGDALISDMAKVYLRHLNLNLHTHQSIDNGQLASQFATLLYQQSFSSAYVTMKDWSDKIIACDNYPEDQDPPDDLAQGGYLFEQFIEETFEGLEEWFDTQRDAFNSGILMIVNHENTNKKANAYFLKASLVISDVSMVRKHCESQTVFKKLITEIIMSD